MSVKWMIKWDSGGNTMILKLTHVLLHFSPSELLRLVSNQLDRLSGTCIASLSHDFSVLLLSCTKITLMANKNTSLLQKVIKLVSWTHKHPPKNEPVQPSQPNKSKEAKCQQDVVKQVEKKRC